MNREFLTHLFFLIFINLLIKPFYIFGIDRAVQNAVEPGAYGLYFVLFNFTYLFQIINDSGIQNYNNRSIAQHPNLIGKYFPNILALKGLLSLVYLLVLALASWAAGYLPQYGGWLIWIAFNQILNSLILFLRTNVSGLGLYRFDGWFSVADKILLIVICGILLLQHPEGFQIEWFIYAQTASLAATACIVGAFVGGKIGRFRLRFQPALLWVIARESYPYALVVLLMTIYTRVDAVMIEQLLPDGAIEAGYYAGAYRLLDAANMIGYLFAALLLPMFARLIKTGEDMSPLTGFSFRLIWAGSVALAVAIWPFRTAIMDLLYVQTGATSGDMLGLLMVSFVAVCGSYVYGTLLTAKGSMRHMNRIFLCGVLGNIALNAVLIPHYKGAGAAVATCITQVIVFLAQVWLAYRELGLSPNLRLIAQSAGAVLLAVFLTWAIVQIPGELHWTIRFLMCGAANVLAALLIGMIPMRGLWRKFYL